MAERFLICIDLDAYIDADGRELATKPSLTQEGLDLKAISFFGRVHILVNSKNYAWAVSFIRNHFARFTTYCDATGLTDITEVISLLNYGAAKVFVAQSQLKQIVEQGSLEDLGRLILSLEDSRGNGRSTSTEEEFQASAKALIDSVPVAVQVNDIDEWSWLDSAQKKSQSSQNHCSRYLRLKTPTLKSYVQAVQAGHIPIIPAGALTVDSDKHPQLIAAHRLITTVIHSDRADGLFPTVVADEHGSCLGLVYSNEKSIECALKLGRGVYHSRSRNGLWIKGEESGDVQELVGIRWDCDADALCFTVRQEGDGNPSIDNFTFERLLIRSRILSFEDGYMFWRICRIITSAKDVANTQVFISCRILYCQTI